MQARTPSNTDAKRDKRRGLLLALLLHGAIVSAFIYPFLLASGPEETPYETVVELHFRELPEVASASSAKARVRNEVKRPTVERAAAPLNPTPPPAPTPPAPPVLTSPAPTPELEVPDVPAPEIAKAPAPVAPPASPTDGRVAESGEGDITGAPNRGTGTTVTDAGDGGMTVGEGLRGNGVLRRAVIFRPDLSSIVRENGVIAVNVCVNPSGNVVGVRFNEERSTITDLAIVREALSKSKDYKFKRDRRAPKLECGVLAVRVDGVE